MGQGAHACGVGDLKSGPAVMSGQTPCGVVHVVICKHKPHIGAGSPLEINI